MNEARIIKQIELNKLQVFINKVDVQTLDEFVKCITHVSESCPDTIVMLLAAPSPTVEAPKKGKNIEEIDTPFSKLMYISTSIPLKAAELAVNLLTSSAKSVYGENVEIIKSENFYVEKSQSTVTYEVIEFPQTGEYFPFKLIDVVMGNAFGVLRKAGLYKDDSDDEEYGLELGD